MVSEENPAGDSASFVLQQVGALKETGDLWEPFQLLDYDGSVVQPVSDYLKDLQAAGRRAATQRSYGMDLLRWFRFLWTIEVPWDKAARGEARDFSRWLQIADKPVRSHWRLGGDHPPTSAASPAARAGPNPVTGKVAPGRKYGTATRAHSETVLRHFYDFHLEVGTGPMANPFPLARGRQGGRPGAHHNPMDPHTNHPSGMFRPVRPTDPSGTFPTTSSTNCSPGSRATVTGRWLPFGLRRALGRLSCWVLREPTPIPVDN